MARYIAHSKNDKGYEHVLHEHLTEVANLMVKFSNIEEYQDIFKVAGLLHDLGKYQPRFQEYLLKGGRRGSVPHASWGAALALYYKQYEAAFVIDGHHKGLPDKADLKDDCIEFLETDNPDFDLIKKLFYQDLQFDESKLESMTMQLPAKERELLIRYLFSSLTDADWLDTEQHFDSGKTLFRIAPVFDPVFLTKKVEEYISGKSKIGNLNRLRNNVREYAISKADLPTGFFSMTLPTGMGKTLASVSWAIKHADKNKLKRIIIVLPFISIIDQTAKELKHIFGDEWVLEHHSNFNENDEVDKDIYSENISNEAYVKRLATENWDFPIVVTTTVQFFESLFSNKPSRCRKVHNIAQSAVIFDEVQTLPKELVLPTLSMLGDVNKIMGTSFLFCTATQPAFEKTEKFKGLENITGLVENPKDIFEATKRVFYYPVNQYKPVEIQELVKKVFEKDVSTLTIFNTKKQALLFYQEICEFSDFKVYHLSTSMYPAHRKRTIENIRKSLSKQEKILVASTQLIEAGVDFDFPCVFREIAPLESIIQSAGRCNREGKMPQYGEVYIFSLSETPPRPMKQYYSLADFANTLYKNNESVLFEHNFFSEYYIYQKLPKITFSLSIFQSQITFYCILQLTALLFLN